MHGQNMMEINPAEPWVMSQLFMGWFGNSDNEIKKVKQNCLMMPFLASNMSIARLKSGETKFPTLKQHTQNANSD